MTAPIRPLDLVNPLQGSDSRREFSRGNTYPAVGVPRGLTYWTPQTDDGVFIYNRRHPKLAGFRATHSPSPWMGDFGHFDVSATLGPLLPMPMSRSLAYHQERVRSSPHRFEAELVRDAIRLSVTATTHCGVIRVAFPPGTDEAFLTIQTGLGAAAVSSEARVEQDGRTLSGTSRANHGGVAGDFGCRWVATVEGADVLGAGTVTPSGAFPGDHSVVHPRAGVFLRVRPEAGGEVTLKIGTSFIDCDHALTHLRREVADHGFEAVAASTAERWNDWLDRLPCPSDDQATQRVFASSLYRAGLFPMRMHEPDPDGATVHRSPYDGEVYPGVLYTNNGFWDTYRTVYPLLTLIDREGFGEIIEGFLAAYREGGWLPKWASPGYRDCMVGTHADSVIAEAVVNNVPGFDVEEAYEAIRRNAFEPGDTGGRWGRLGLASYLELGYVADDAAPYSVCRTLDFAYCDWCVAQVAARVGRTEDAAVLLERSLHYRNLWHEESGFMRPRRSDGSWVEPWTQFDWGGAYIEGGPWQHSWTVPHDLDGLAKLMGGRDGLADKLEAVFTTPPRYTPGHYLEEIHEMSEMALAVDREGCSFGQYAQSNQPAHAILWQLAALGRHGFVADQLRRVNRDLFTPEHFPGDEDNGEMGAWFVLSTLGKYRLCPGSTHWTQLKDEFA